MPIRALPEQLVNQIAAGEVVERPASAVKELVENSLDAGATRVDVELDRGGLVRIEVRDDGAGIPPEELSLALSPHATSKVSSLQDLERVGTLGFRGEALPSLLSVSRLSITSRPAGAEHGHRVGGAGRLDGGVLPAPHPPGTTVEVRDLFFNTPARRKFMRTPATEFRHADQALRRIALARFDNAFSLTHGSRRSWTVKAATGAEQRAARVAELTDPALLDNAVHLDAERLGMLLSGWIAVPAFARAQADLQHLHVNGRPIRDRRLSHALRRAYADVLHGSLHPAYVLYLDLDAAGVDVNVHPAKAEVRFRDGAGVYDFVFGAVQRALRDLRPDPVHHHRSGPRLPEFRAGRPAATFAGARFPGAPGVALAEPRPAFADSPQSDHDARPLGQAVAQLHGTFVLSQNAQGVVLVDMHAAHERILFERFKAQHRAGAVTSQALLVPAVVGLPEDLADRAEAEREGLSGFGLDVERSGPAEVTVRGVPPLLSGSDYATLLRAMLDDAVESDSRRHFADVQDRQDRRIADLACRAAIRSGRALALPEMDRLLRDMEGTENAGQCSHGRPTWVQLGHADLDRLFLRGR